MRTDCAKAQCRTTDVAKCIAESLSDANTSVSEFCHIYFKYFNILVLIFRRLGDLAFK